MATIDLIVLGILKQEPLSAYDIQKLVEYRNISRWVKISTPSIYKKVLQLEEKGLIVRSLGSEDRRQMYFHLTHTGKQRVNELELDKVEIPDLLKPLFK